MNNHRGNLDFIVIGAAKSGTTTLFELIKKHPEIIMPEDKEVPFYSEDEIYNKGQSWYISEYFHNVNPGSKLGTVTPQYMLGQGETSPAEIAKRIHDNNQNIKLGAILRNPIERAYSHYNMLMQRGHFTESFETATKKLLRDEKLQSKREKNISDKTSFLLGGEYGRILNDYLSYFDKNNILLQFTSDLKNNPDKVVRSIFDFIEVDTGFKPKNLGEKYRKGGSTPRVKLLTPGVIFKIPYIKKLWKEYTPYTFRKKVEYNINLWNTKSGSTKLDPTSRIYKDLVAFYSDDIKRLEKTFDLETPWEEWDSSTV